MKIAIATFHNNKKEAVVGGITTGPFIMKRTLESLRDDISVDIVSLVKKTKYSCDGVVYLDDIEDINRYDFIIFKTPGKQLEKFDEEKKDTKYSYLLEKLTTPFSFIVNEERDKSIFPYWESFANHPMMSFVMFNSIGMHEDFPEMYAKCGEYVEFNYTTMTRFSSSQEALKKAITKDKVITSTARWNSRKRVLELTKLAPELVKLGYKVKIYGANQIYFQGQKILNSNPEFWENRGYYDPSEIEEVLSDASFHYNFVFLKNKVKDRVMRPRIEIATFEAVENGCLPILCSQTTPEWVSSDSAIVLDPKDIDKIPMIISEMSTQERLGRIESFYKLAKSNCLPKYFHLVKRIEESIL